MKRSEYPRPAFKRANWQPLNGVWQFAFDDENIGLEQQWYNTDSNFPMQILVPFAFQTPLSGIYDESFHDIVWYKRTFEVNRSENEQVILHFGAVDFISDVYLNGTHVNHHEGGQTGFSIDVTDFLTGEEEVLVVRVFDSSTDLYFPRGKQYWKEKSESIWYNRTTGIWQSVWLEVVNEAYIENIRFTPRFDEGIMKIDVKVSKPGELLTLKVYTPEGKLHGQLEEKVSERVVSFDYTAFKVEADVKEKAWHPNNPYLFDVSATYGEDEVKTYFGMRKISHKDGKVLLNNEPYYLKLVLDQGYWPESLVTPPSIEALEYDIVAAKEMGFNGARKHQKVEDPYYFYLADKHGFLVWSEMASSIHFNEQSAHYDLLEWEASVKRDYNHPSIIVWVPLNESWGVPEIGTDKRQQQHSIDLYNLIKKLDPTRLISNNDGWEITKTDITGIHNYMHGQDDDEKKKAQYRHDLSNKENLLASRPANRDIYAEGWEYEGTPIILTEFGGISFGEGLEAEDWGYTAAGSVQDLLRDYARIIQDVKDSTGLAGYCYTQLSDVEQETNGFLSYNRKPKVDLAKIKAINDSV